MKLRNRFRKEGARPRAYRLARPALEQLETRTVPSAATSAIASGLVNSTENFANIVTKDYQTFLHRAPDPAGLAGWVGAMQAGLTAEQLDAILASSAEDLALHGGAGLNWVNSLYQDFLHRLPSGPEQVTWMTNLAGGMSPLSVAAAFATGPERYMQVITDEYQSLLGRPPEAGPPFPWLDAMLGGLSRTGLESILVGSDEFYARANNDPTTFLVSAFQDVLGRLPGQNEIDVRLPVLGAPVPTVSSAASQNLVDLKLNPIDINLLGLEIQTDPIEVTVSAQPGQGQLLGNLLTTVSNLVNLQGVNNALNNVLGSVVGLLDSTALTLNTTIAASSLPTPAAATTPVLDLFVAPVHVNLLGALVDTSPIHLTITAHSGPGLVLGNVVTDLANLFNPPLPSTLDINFINTKLQELLGDLNTALPGISSAPVHTVTLSGSATSEQILSLAVPPINVNLLGLVLKTSEIDVNATSNTGNGLLLGNVLQTLLNTLGATPQNLVDLNNNLNSLLAKVVGVLNAANLVLPSTAVSSLTSTLQTLSLPNLINTTGTATAPILNLAIASTDGTTPPVDVNLLGLQITTSNIQAQLLAQTGDGQILGNLLYNVANLLNPGGSLNLLSILNDLGV